MIIGLWAPRSAGKTTVAGMLARNHGFVEVSFADPLKQLAHKLFGWPMELLYGPSEGKERVCPEFSHEERWRHVDEALSRMLDDGTIHSLFDDAPEPPGFFEVEYKLYEVLDYLESLGGALTPRVALQWLGTEFGRALWEDVWVHNAVKRAVGNRLVFSDVRFANEAKVIHDRGGSVVWIDSSGRGVQEGQTGHASESTFTEAAPHVDMVLLNNGTMADLEVSLAGVVDCINLGLPCVAFR